MKNSGQALITLLFFVLIGITIVSATLFIIFTNSKSGEKLQLGIIAYEIAQSGVENAMLQLLRNPSYTGESMTIGDGTVTINVSSNSGTFTITSEGKLGNFIRKIQATGTYSNYIFNFSQLKEVYN